MFAFKVATILAVAAATFAHPALQARGGCSTGALQCCDSISPAGSNNTAGLGGTLPVALQGLNVPIGVNCLPISVTGAGTSGTCSAQSACCGSVDNSGALPLGVDCTPINTGL